MAYHIVIATERRKALETPMGLDMSRLASAMAENVPTGKMVKTLFGEAPEYIAGPMQLHTCSDAPMPDKDWSDPQFVMVAEWDLRSPFVIVHKGDYSARTMSYAGWPDVTQTEYEVMEGRT